VAQYGVDREEWIMVSSRRRKVNRPDDQEHDGSGFLFGREVREFQVTVGMC